MGLAKVLGVVGGMAVGLVLGCGKDTGSAALTDTTADGGLADAATVTCLVGASAADCQKCSYGASQCDVACPPAGEVIPWPTPPRYQHACTLGTCCICQFDSWQVSFLRCETDCEALVRQWLAIVGTAPIGACQRREDCGVVSEAMTCDCTPSIGGCGTAVNLAAYAASQAPALASTFKESCTKPGICDCGPPQGVDCVNGVCAIDSFASCFPAPDAP